MHTRLLVPVGLIALVGVATPLMAQVLTNSTFIDVPPEDSFFEAVENLAAKGIIQGYGDGMYRPDANITRAEFTKIVVSAVAGQGEIDGCMVNASARGHRPLFRDVLPGDWFAKYVCVAREQGIVGGYPDGTFQPNTEINFVEAAKIVVRATHISTTQDIITEDAIWYRPFVLALEEWQAIPLNIDSLTHIMTRGEMAEILFRLQEKRGKPSRTYADFSSFWTSYFIEQYGVEVPYPKIASVPVFDADGEPTSSSVAYPGKSLWRLNLGAKVDCGLQLTFDFNCEPYEWTADGISRDSADKAVDTLFTIPERITILSDTRSIGKRVIIYTEVGTCTHKEALVLGPEAAVRLRWFCGATNKDYTSNYAFEYIAEHIEFFNLVKQSSAASSTSSVLASSMSSMSSSSTIPVLDINSVASSKRSSRVSSSRKSFGTLMPISSANP